MEEGRKEVNVTAAQCSSKLVLPLKSEHIYFTRLKNIKNVKGCRDGMPKSMQTR